MSRIFYDHLIAFEKIERQIKKVVNSTEERDELWHLVDEIIHHQVIGCILDKLPSEHHGEFLEKLNNAPYDDEIMRFLDSKTSEDIEKAIKEELDELSSDIYKLVK